MGIMMAGCSKGNDIIDTPQQPEKKDHVVTLTTTISMDGGAQTRALNAEGVKTFAVGETMAVIYTNTSGTTQKAVSDALIDGNIASDGKSAKFTFELTNPDKTQNVTYIYPAAMAGDTDVDYNKLSTQDGTLSKLSSSLDLATKTAAWNGTDLPSTTLENQLAILEIKLKNSDGPSEITSDITGMTISDGTNSYTVSRSAAAGPIYVAIRPTSSASIALNANDGTSYYTKSLTDKTYEVNNIYPVNWKMEKAYPFTVAEGKKVLFAPGNLQYNSNESTYKWRFAEHQYDCEGSWDTSKWIDLFGWGTWTGEATNPANTSTGGTYSWDGDDFKMEAQLADANHRSYDWRTLSQADWNCIFKTRSASTVNSTANARYAKATVASKSGIILFPDSYTHPDGVTAPASINDDDDAYIVNNYNADDWTKMEAAGCVFLPAAGDRIGEDVVNENEGFYWSKTSSSEGAYHVHFTSTTLDPSADFSRFIGRSVRLVRDL